MFSTKNIVSLLAAKLLLAVSAVITPLFAMNLSWFLLEGEPRLITAATIIGVGMIVGSICTLISIYTVAKGRYKKIERLRYVLHRVLGQRRLLAENSEGRKWLDRAEDTLKNTIAETEDFWLSSGVIFSLDHNTFIGRQFLDCKFEEKLDRNVKLQRVHKKLMQAEKTLVLHSSKQRRKEELILKMKSFLPSLQVENLSEADFGEEKLSQVKSLLKKVNQHLVVRIITVKKLKSDSWREVVIKKLNRLTGLLRYKGTSDAIYLADMMENIFMEVHQLEWKDAKKEIKNLNALIRDANKELSAL